MFIKKEILRMDLIFEDGKLPVLSRLTRSYDNPRWFSNAHVHYDETELVYIAKGKAVFTINQQEFPVKEGDILIVEHGMIHSAVSDETDPSDIFSCSIAEYKIYDRAPDTLLKAENLIPIQSAGKYRPFLDACWKQLLSAQDPDDQTSISICNMIAGSIVCIYYSLLKEQEQTYVMPEHHFTHDIMTFIYGHYAENITLDRLAKEFHMSAGHISHEFSRMFGISPINYAINLRMDQAKWLLFQSDLSIKEVASEVGYRNVQHFTKIFQKRIGCLPEEYRERAFDEKKRKKSE